MQFRGRLFGSIKECLKPTAKDLVLVGDNFPLYASHINRSRSLLQYVSNNWERVFIVPGVVELFGNGLRSWTRNIDEFQDFLKESPQRNIYMLNNTEIHDGDNLLVGSTFWCGSSPMMDIVKSQPFITINTLDKWAKEDAEFIGRTIRMAALQKKKLTLATYFTPSKLSPATCNIMYSQLRDIDEYIVGGTGKWITGAEILDALPPIDKN